MWGKVIFGLLLLASVVSCYPQSRVVNGTDSNIRKYPYMASLRSGTRHICGCSLIAPRWVLTAAHCVTNVKPARLTVQFALTDINPSGPNSALIRSIHIHKDYAPAQSYANDIALMEVSGILVFNYKTVAPVQLPEQNYEIAQVPEGAPGILTGWGYDKTGGSTQYTLQEVNLKIYSDKECYERHNGEVTADHICGGVDEGYKGQCSGDSGGPLVQRLSTGYVQIGIVSWSVKPCAVYPYPGVYTKVSHYVDWIYDIMNSIDGMQ